MDVSVSPAAVRWAALRVVAKHQVRACPRCRPDGTCDMYRWATEELRSAD